MENNFKFVSNKLDIHHLGLKINISTKQSFHWSELVYFVILPMFLSVFLVDRIIVPILWILIFSIYFLLRLPKSVFYYEIEIDLVDKIVLKKYFKGNQLINKRKVIDVISMENFHFKEINRNGKNCYVLIYQISKINEELIMMNSEDYIKVKEILEQYN